MISHQDRLLVVRFLLPHRMLSWAIVGGGFRTGTTVAWLQVTDNQLPLGVDPAVLLTDALGRAGVSGAVGLLTSSPLNHAVNVGAKAAIAGSGDELHVRCLATVGLGNALRAGDAPATTTPSPPRGRDDGDDDQPSPVAPAPAGPRHVGTINMCLWLSRALTDEALVEAQALCAEARAMAMLDAGVNSTVSGRPATGTGTDCQVVAAPAAGTPLRFVGKHTAAGHLIGAVVGTAMATGIARWVAETRRREQA